MADILQLFALSKYSIDLAAFVSGTSPPARKPPDSILNRKPCRKGLWQQSSRPKGKHSLLAAARMRLLPGMLVPAKYSDVLEKAWPWQATLPFHPMESTWQSAFQVARCG